MGLGYRGQRLPLLQEEAMSEPVCRHDEIEGANASFWCPVSLDHLLLDVEPVSSLDEFAIDDLTDEEWERFCSAINE